MLKSRVLSVLVTALCAVGLVAAGAAPASAKPGFVPTISVYLADGVTPVGATPLHPGDQLVVKGSGFDPRSNTGGLPVPVPPGVPHGTFIAFGAFAPKWQPSKGAPESSRALVRSTTKWALSRDALSKVPSVPFDLNRTVRQQWVPLDSAGRFTARLTLATPTGIPAGARWGVYTYGAADATNARQELSVPVRYSTEAGPNTPKPAVKNLVWGFSPTFSSTVEKSGGALSGSEGAGVDKASGAMSFELVSTSLRNGRGTLRYRGTVVAFTKFHLLEIALADPIVRVDGTRAVLSMDTSSTDMNGDDALRRIDVADLHLTKGQAAKLARGEKVPGIRAAFRPGIAPTSLAALTLSGASPVTLAF